MWDIIVLGQVPGTQIQVNFETWLAVVIGLAAGIVILRSTQIIRSSQWLLARRVNRVLQRAAYAQWLISRGYIQA